MQTDTDEAFIWQIANADKGDFLVMRASGDDAYNPWIMELSVASKNPLNSVTTILFNDKKASEDPDVLKLIRNAEAIFFAGGDQSLYMSYWVGTEVQSIIQAKLVNTTVGGTSAGLAIQGEKVTVEIILSFFCSAVNFPTLFINQPAHTSCIFLLFTYYRQLGVQRRDGLSGDDHRPGGPLQPGDHRGAAAPQDPVPGDGHH